MNDLPEFTYTVENELDDEPAFTGTLKVYSPNARNDAAGTYEIEVDLSGVSYTVNYKPGDPPYINGTLTVASTDATLSGLTISEGELPDFSPLTMEYNVTVPGSIRSLTVTPTASDHNAEISVNGTEVKSGMPSGEIPLNVGPNTITIEVTSQDGKAKETYTVNVYVLANFSGSGDSEEDPYLIQTAEDLKDMAYLINEGIEPYANVGKHYKLANDIDLSAFANDDNDKGWTPIGTYEKPFKGIFDGNGKSITGLKIDRPGESDIGLFGYVSGGTIKNLQVTAEVEGRLTVGGIVGRLNNYGLVQNCFINGSVTGMQGVGGIAGEITGTSKILNSGSNVNVLGLNHVGGIVGNINSSSGVQNCYSAGSVTADREDPYLLAYPNHYVGGIAGWLQDLYGNSFVRNCYSIAEIVGDNMVGGIVGRGERSRIEDCFALNPSVSSEGSVGRVLGYNNYASCFNLYAFAGMKVIGQSITGAGETAININQISDSSFWTTSDKWYGSAWDENVWVFENNKLPMLKNVPGQSEDALRWDISELDIDITGSYIYTGELIDPTVTLCGEPLGKEFYQTSILSGDGYSNGIDAGKVGIRLTGEGLLKGYKDLEFTIGRRPVTVKADDKIISAGDATPTFTYTVEGQIPGKPALTGQPILFSPDANYNEPGTYTIEVNMAGVGVMLGLSGHGDGIDLARFSILCQ